jgi:hypothetical protein
MSFLCRLRHQHPATASVTGVPRVNRRRAHHMWSAADTNIIWLGLVLCDSTWLMATGLSDLMDAAAVRTHKRSVCSVCTSHICSECHQHNARACSASQQPLKRTSVLCRAVWSWQRLLCVALHALTVACLLWCPDFGSIITCSEHHSALKRVPSSGGSIHLYQALQQSPRPNLLMCRNEQPDGSCCC